MSVTVRPIYLDNAATSFPKPSRVYEKLREYLERYGGCPGRGSYDMAKEAEAVLEQTRSILAELFHIEDTQRIAFTLNATDALNMAIKGLLEPGDHVVTTIMEHNSVIRPLNALVKRGAIRLTRVAASKEGLIDPEDIRSAITDRTKLVAVVHASNVTGSLQPIEEIGRIVREAGRIFLVDAAQTAGAYPIDVERMRIDLLAFPGHKALFGPPGTGGLYAGERATVRPWREGGTGLVSELPLQPEDFPLRLEAGSPNTLGIALLGDSARFIMQFDASWIRSHEMVLTQRLLDGLREDRRIHIYGPMDNAKRVAVVSVTVDGCSPEDVGAFLNERYRIAVRTGLHCAPGAHQTIGTAPSGSIRISPGYFTNESDIDQCVAALKEAAERLPQQMSCRTSGGAP